MPDDTDTEALESALAAGPTGYRPGDSTWVSVNGSTVMLDSPRPVWARIATCDRDQTAAYIAAANPARIRRILDRLRAAERDAARYRGLRAYDAGGIVAQLFGEDDSVEDKGAELDEWADGCAKNAALTASSAGETER